MFIDAYKGRVELNGPAEKGEGRARIALAQKNCGDAAVTAGMAWVGLDCFLKVAHRLIQVPRIGGDSPEVLIRVGKRRIQGKCLPIPQGRLGEAPLGVVKAAGMQAENGIFLSR